MTNVFTRALLAAAVLSVSATGIGIAFAQQNTTAATTSSSSSNNSSLSGIITSLQLNEAGAPQWLTAGSWTLVTDRPIFGGNESQQPTVQNFSAVIVMTTLNNGTMLHSHRISDFKLLGVTHPGQNSTALNGTMTVTTENSPTRNVHGYLDFQNNRMSILVNPGAINNHFGPTPINGMILNAQQLQEIRSLESPTIQPSAMTTTNGNNTR